MMTLYCAEVVFRPGTILTAQYENRFPKETGCPPHRLRCRRPRRRRLRRPRRRRRPDRSDRNSLRGLEVIPPSVVPGRTVVLAHHRRGVIGFHADNAAAGGAGAGAGSAAGHFNFG